MTDLIIQAPKDFKQLVLLLHGVGSSPTHLKPLGQAIAAANPQALIVALAAPFVDERGLSQWFSVAGVTEQNRPERVIQALPAFFQCLAPWLQQARAAAIEPVLFGFSQGGIMLLEAAKNSELSDCHLLVCATRFASLPDQALSVKSLGWLHGQHDPLFSPELVLQAKQRLARFGQDIEPQFFAGMQHELPTQAAVDWISALM
jgi:phospholipase/carboxylesterase